MLNVYHATIPTAILKCAAETVMADAFRWALLFKPLPCR